MGLDAKYRVLVGTLAAAALIAVAGPAQACRLALAFALDVSASVDPGEYRLQVEGLAAALKDPEVRSAMLGPAEPVALTAYEWSGAQQQASVAAWTIISGAEKLDAFARTVAGHKRHYSEFPTAIGYALGYGAALMEHAPPCRRRVIDVSGDGINNAGFGPKLAYSNFNFSNVTVNGLVVGGDDLKLVSFYETEVAHGPNAFVEVAADYADYARVMRRKLLRELAGDRIAAATGPRLAAQPWLLSPPRHP